MLLAIPDDKLFGYNSEIVAAVIELQWWKPLILQLINKCR